MIKVRRGFTEAKIKRFLEEGRGKGSHGDYSPWLTTVDVTALRSRKTRFRGLKSNRVHHTFTDFEAEVLYAIDWSDNVVDVRERYPMDRDQTRRIASDARIEHPVDAKSRAPLVQYSDVLVDRADGTQVACSLVLSKDIGKKVVLARLEIQRRYWAAKRTAWRIISEKQLNANDIANIEFCRSHIDLERQTEGRNSVASTAPELLARIERYPERSLQSICDALDADRKLAEGSALFVLRHLLGIKRLVWAPGELITTALSAGSLTVATEG